ncbi:2-amino-4-hydroxy-6-hydroxymethyldihydropteridine diphosphokinase [Martelella radicis]|uniref:2-amino-4-hydroxy-6-hydroxymethyldihydropteridine pyrophosphokinase n=1 Tax=Martelella radicis TaxID=1397476 RepID=A0A7W6P9X7_9HYPH|nr:2-amino-4-hydroxy-6-hydroxymethyldihydropteridine diphosphokinase [Martelella radicis]MBB4121826.1 2-amino-4-hydroxy-6-hydroxymethyldihydropteridine diphosphokinase [Martelella radicis]
MSNERGRAALGLGGNLGEPALAMASALSLLDGDPETTVVAVSRLFRTPPWGPVPQPPFINCCALIETERAPEALMRFCLDIEKRLKRVRDQRWGPRLIDIDILTFGDLSRESALLTLPHPRMTERGFVLVPLAEIAPEQLVGGRTVAEWRAMADTADIDPVSEDGSWWKV